MDKNLALYNPSSSFPQGSDGGFLVPLTQGKYSIIDKEDASFVNEHKWLAHYSRGKYYAQRGQRCGKAKKVIHMHREINKTPEGMYTDHINGNSLDNRKENLRTCTYLENNRNARLRKDNLNGHAGISKSKGFYRSYIHVNGKQIALGKFNDLEKALKIRKEAEKKHWYAKNI